MRKKVIKNHKPSTTSYQLNIAWLYPDLMSTYGDRGNILVLQKRCEWRGIKVKVEKIFVASDHKLLANCHLLFMGGAQDTQQEIVNKDLFENKGKIISEKINEGVPGLFICGAYQFLGNYYKTADGTVLPGLKLFPVFTENPGENGERLIGNIIGDVHSSQFMVHSSMSREPITNNQIVGFENHGGRTYLEIDAQPFATVMHGFGNNGVDKTEGLLYKNSIGTYLHGPILPKNPEITDWLIQKALEIKYKRKIELKPLDDTLAQKAKDVIIKRYS